MIDHTDLIERLEKAREGNGHLWREVLFTLYPRETDAAFSDIRLLTFQMMVRACAWTDAALMLMPSGWTVSMRRHAGGDGWCSADTGPPASKQYVHAQFAPAAICAVALRIDMTVTRSLNPGDENSHE